jgi:serine/threonine protein kinase
LDASLPARIGKYDIVSVIGRGGMGVVYLAQDRRMGRRAIKTLTAEAVNIANAIERFYEEAECMARLRHPNIVTVHDQGEQDGLPYIVMEYVEGQPLDNMIRERQTTPMVEKLRIIEQVCSALGYAHQQNVIHRDVKPANVIVQEDGTAKLLDFGIARGEKRTNQGLTQTGSVIGTVPYMAPERLRGAPLDGRSDIFAIGVMLYQLLTGQLPFQGEDGVLVTQILSEPHPPLNTLIDHYPLPLEGIVERALAKDVRNRYSTCEEMGAELFAVIDVLKREHIGEVIVQVHRLQDEHQFVRARDALMQVLRLDNQHTEARRLLAEIQQNLSRKQREEQADELTEQAQTLLRKKEWDPAIQLLDQAAKLMPDDKELAELLDSARRKKTLHDQIDGYLRRADAARQAGDLDSAQRAVKQAEGLDAEDSRVRQALSALARQAEEAASRARARTMLEEARKELKQRHFAEALEALAAVEQCDPFHPELEALRSAATTGAEQEQRRTLLDAVEAKVARAVTCEELEAALVTIDEALDSTLNDPALLRLQAQVKSRLAELERQRRVEKAVRDGRATMDTSPTEALNIIQQELVRYPGDERLLSLKTSIEERFARMSRDEARQAFLRQAREALRHNKYGDAVSILESCSAELKTQELAELLEFARGEAHEQEHREFVANAQQAARQMIEHGRFDEAIAYLEPIAPDADDATLNTLLDRARAARALLAQQAVAAVNEVKPLLDAGGYEQAVAFLDGLKPELRAMPTVQQALDEAQAQLERERLQLGMVGHLYATLETPFTDSDWQDARVPTGETARPVAEIVRAWQTRRASLATRTIAADLGLIRQKVQAGEVTGVEQMLEVRAVLVPYAAAEVQTEWRQMSEQQKARKSGGLKGMLKLKTKS